MTVRARHQPEDEESVGSSDQFWSVVRMHLAFRDDDIVRADWEPKWMFGIGFGCNPMALVFRQAQARVARDAILVIQGPAGSPNEELARIINDAVPGQSKPVRILNCAGAGPSELSNAVAAAHKLATTLVLTHLDKADPPFQRKLLGILDAHPRPVLPRYILTTTRDLSDLVAADQFDADLIACLNFDRRIVLPALRDHIWDIIPTVVSRLLCNPRGTKIQHVSYAAIMFLWKFPWTNDLSQLVQLVDDLVIDAYESGATAIRLEQITRRCRRLGVPLTLPAPEKLEAQRLAHWQVRLGNPEIAQYFVSQFTPPEKNESRHDDGWAKFERANGYCPVLFASDVGEHTLVCNLRLHPLCSSRRWLASEKNSKRRGWKKILDEAERSADRCKVTVESADAEILFDVQKMERDLEPFLVRRSTEDMPSPATHGSRLSRKGRGTKLCGRRHPTRDWRIHDEVKFGYNRLGFGRLDDVCSAVSKNWENIGSRRVKNLYYELEGEDPPPKYTSLSSDELQRKYPDFNRPEMG